MAIIMASHVSQTDRLALLCSSSSMSGGMTVVLFASEPEFFCWLSRWMVTIAIRCIICESPERGTYKKSTVNQKIVVENFCTHLRLQKLNRRNIFNTRSK